MTWASWVAQLVNNLPTIQKTPVWFLGQEDPLEKGMATHSSILAWRIPWTEESGSLQSTGSQSDTNERLSLLLHFQVCLVHPSSEHDWSWQRDLYIKASLSKISYCLHSTQTSKLTNSLFWWIRYAHIQYGYCRVVPEKIVAFLRTHNISLRQSTICCIYHITLRSYFYFFYVNSWLSLNTSNCYYWSWFQMLASHLLTLCNLFYIT